MEAEFRLLGRGELGVGRIRGEGEGGEAGNALVEVAAGPEGRGVPFGPFRLFVQSIVLWRFPGIVVTPHSRPSRQPLHHP